MVTILYDKFIILRLSAVQKLMRSYIVDLKKRIWTIYSFQIRFFFLIKGYRFRLKITTDLTPDNEHDYCVTFLTGYARTS